VASPRGARPASRPGLWKLAVAGTGLAFFLALLETFHARDEARAALKAAQQAALAAEAAGEGGAVAPPFASQGGAVGGFSGGPVVVTGPS
jgi:hypothetical protein